MLARLPQPYCDENSYKKVQNVVTDSRDKRGMQPPVSPRTAPQQKSREPHKLRENATFAEVVDILENARVAGTGFEPATSRL